MIQIFQFSAIYVTMYPSITFLLINSNTVTNTNFLLVNSVNLSCRVMEILIIEEEEKKTTNPFYQII